VATALSFHHCFTAAEYLAFERASDERHEWYDGVIYDMAGESPNHRRLRINLTRMLSTHLRGHPCEVFGSDTKVCSGPKLERNLQGFFSYPDLGVVCPPERYHDEVQDVLLNPRVIIEVLSPSTQAFDRDNKRGRYFRYLETLEDYVLVAQDQPQVEHWHRHADGVWRATLLEGLEALLTLEGIGAQLPLAEVYERVVFEVPPSEKNSPHA
jgi:Uma2 family endonuclease